VLINKHPYTDDPLSDLRFTGPVEFTIRVNSPEAAGYDEYIENHGYRCPLVICSFMGTKNEERRSEELASSGLMQNGQIISTKQVGEEGTRSG